MAKAQWCGQSIYDIGQSFKDTCLEADGSLFTPDRSIWTAANIEALDGRVGASDVGGGTFVGKLRAQLEGAPADAVQLGAELLYIVLLFELDTGGPKKREHLDTILQELPEQIAVPTRADEALDGGGVANFSAAKAYRDAYMRFLVRLVVRLKTERPEARASLLSAPWAFRELVAEVRTPTDEMEANALLHLLYPDDFEYMVSKGHRQKLLSAFSDAPEVREGETVDHQIQVIRTLASPKGGPELDLYADPFHRVWNEPASPAWQEAVSWCQRLYARDDFDRTERNYKLALAAKLAVARNSLLAGEDSWLSEMASAFRDKTNNLTNWRVHDPFLDWCDHDEPGARALVTHLWSADSAEAGLRAFLDHLPQEAVRGTGTRVRVASFMLLALDAERLPLFKPSTRDALHKVLGLPSMPTVDLDPEATYRPEELAARLGLDGLRVRNFLRATYPRDITEKGSPWSLTADQAESVMTHFAEDVDATNGDALYAEWRTVLEELRLRMLAAGTQLRDPLDAQGLAWWLVESFIPEDWSDADRAALERFRTGASEPPPGDEPSTAGGAGASAGSLPAPTQELASTLHIPLPWLQRLLDLLEEKRQLILYGPPGTGKTFVAQHIGKHIAVGGGAFRLVQFHPSYTYEDFFEGYRPRQHEGGALSFDLVPGALREIAEQAAAHPEEPYLLIIDEINRGNIAKIFGELYFLLEYRDQAIRLQYSRHEQFSLPENLYVIGTMNTADRSIALVDSALRRRFYFLGLIPTREPVSSVLEQWLTAHGLEPEPAALLRALNDAIDEEDFSIGPSYLMTKAGTAPDIERTWEYAIMPLLEEHYYGAGRNLEQDFGVAALRKKIAAEADAEASSTQGDDDA